jgi:hypothetical protein
MRMAARATASAVMPGNAIERVAAGVGVVVKVAVGVVVGFGVGVKVAVGVGVEVAVEVGVGVREMAAFAD